jgi:hypothetical protein
MRILAINLFDTQKVFLHSWRDKNHDTPIERAETELQINISNV